MRFLKVSSWDDLKLPRSFGDLPPSDRVLGCGCAGYSVKLMRHKAKLHSRFTSHERQVSQGFQELLEAWENTRCYLSHQ